MVIAASSWSPSTSDDADEDSDTNEFVRGRPEGQNQPVIRFLSWYRGLCICSTGSQGHCVIPVSTIVSLSWEYTFKVVDMLQLCFTILSAMSYLFKLKVLRRDYKQFTIKKINNTHNMVCVGCGLVEVEATVWHVANCIKFVCTYSYHEYLSYELTDKQN